MRWWWEEDADHIRHRSQRYPSAWDLDLAWTVEAVADAHRLVWAPDPRSRVGYTRLVGYSPSAGSVLA